MLKFSEIRNDAKLVKMEIERLGETPISKGISNAIAALVAGEDRRFRSHTGFDPLGIIRAALSFMRTKKVSGASTIEQQLVRTIRARYEITLWRKVSEILIALLVSRSFPKDQLAVAYLKLAYFGWRSQGIDAAAQRYQINVNSMTLHEASFLISLLRYPLPKHPSVERLEQVKRRARYIEAVARQRAS